jgi:hypothetical protein
MPELWGIRFSQSELLRRVGRIEQVAGVRLAKLGDGLERGVRVLEFRTGSGFIFDVVVDRCLDVVRCELAGQSLSWHSPNGVTAPGYYDPVEWGWFRSWAGGMVTTCGLDHTNDSGEDTAEHFHQMHIRKTVRYGLHGRVGGLPARLTGYGHHWVGDECVLWAEGEVLQSEVFGEHMLLRRRIEARVGESCFRIHDVVKNVGHDRTSHMYLYHCNAGYPVVDDTSEVLVPATRVWSSGYPGAVIEGYRILTSPVAATPEYCFEHDLVAEPVGTVPVAIVNRQIGLGVYQVFRIDQQPHLTVWRMLGEGDYALGLCPSTNRDGGRWDARKRGELIELGPGEGREYDLEIGALSGAAEIEGFAARVAALR